MDKETVLQEIGLTKNEAKVYSTLLTLGASSAGKIAEQCKLHRTNVYDALERLLKKGLVAFVNTGKKGEVKTFEATDPNHLLTILDHQKNRLQSILPVLLLDKQLAKKTSAHIYEGIQAFMNILYSFLKYNEPILVYGIPKNAPEALKNHIIKFHKTRAEKKIPMRVIYNYDAQDRLKYVNNLPYLITARYIDDQFKSLVSTNICGDEVVLALWIDPVMVIQIKNEQIAKAYKHYFEVLWKNAIS